MNRVFSISGAICLIAICINLILLISVQIAGPGSLAPGVFADFVLIAWFVTTLAGLLAAAVTLLSALLLLVLWRSELKSPWWPLIFVSAALGFVPLNFTIAQAALALERVHQITVVNESDHRVPSLRLSGGIDHELGPLPPAARRTFKLSVQHEGKLIVSAEVNGQTSQVLLDEWVHPQKGAGRSRTISVTPDGSVQVTEGAK